MEINGGERNEMGEAIQGNGDGEHKGESRQIAKDNEGKTGGEAAAEKNKMK